MALTFTISSFDSHMPRRTTLTTKTDDCNGPTLSRAPSSSQWAPTKNGPYIDASAQPLTLLLSGAVSWGDAHLLEIFRGAFWLPDGLTADEDSRHLRSKHF